MPFKWLKCWCHINMPHYWMALIRKADAKQGAKNINYSLDIWLSAAEKALVLILSLLFLHFKKFCMHVIFDFYYFILPLFLELISLWSSVLGTQVPDGVTHFKVCMWRAVSYIYNRLSFWISKQLQSAETALFYSSNNAILRLGISRTEEGLQLTIHKIHF